MWGSAASGLATYELQWKSAKTEMKQVMLPNENQVVQAYGTDTKNSVKTS